MLIIPAIDIIGNSVVRLSKGKYDDVTEYKNTPLEQAVKYNELGFEWLHCIDLIGSKEGSINVESTIKEIKNATRLKIEFGGGVRSSDDVKKLVDLGVDRVIVGSMSVKNTSELEVSVNEVGPENIVIAADVLDRKIMIKGWTEDSGVVISDHITYCKSLGIKTLLVTDIDKDGLLAGPSVDLYRSLLEEFTDIDLIASGGVSSMTDIRILSESGCNAVVVGKAIYENKIDLKELSEFGN